MPRGGALSAFRQSVPGRPGGCGRAHTVGRAIRSARPGRIRHKFSRGLTRDRLAVGRRLELRQRHRLELLGIYLHQQQIAPFAQQHKWPSTYSKLDRLSLADSTSPCLCVVRRNAARRSRGGGRSIHRRSRRHESRVPVRLQSLIAAIVLVAPHHFVPVRLTCSTAQPGPYVSEMSTRSSTTIGLLAFTLSRMLARQEK